MLLSPCNVKYYMYVMLLHQYYKVLVAEQLSGDVLLTHNPPSTLVCAALGVVVHSGEFLTVL